MDYSKLTLAKRTRLQEQVFFQQYNEEKKKKKAAENQKAAEKQKEPESSAGDRGSRYGDSGDGAAADGGDSRYVADSGQFQANVGNVGFQEGSGSVFHKERMEKNHGVLIDEERENQGNVGRVESEKTCESRKKIRTEKLKRNSKVVETFDDDDDDDDDVVFLRVDYSKAKVGVERGAAGSSCDGGSKGLKGTTGESTESNASGSAESVSGPGDSEESESEEESEGSSDQDYLGSGDDDLDASSSCSDFAEEDDEPGVRNGKGKEKAAGMGREERVKAGLKRCRGKSPEVVFLRQSGVEGEAEDRVRFKRRQEESPEVVFLGQSRGDGGELNGDDVRKRGFVEGDGEEESTESRGRGRPLGKKNYSLVDGERDGSGGFKRKRYSGLDILVGCDEEQDGKEEESEGPKSVAERLRLRPRRGNKEELGGVSCPFTLTDEDEDLESSSSGEDEDTNEISDRSEKSKGKVGRPPGKGRRDHGDSTAPMSVNVDEDICCKDGEPVGKAREKAKEKVGRPAKRRPSIPVAKILADSILQKGDVLVEELVSSKAPDMEPTLPLKFRFLDEELITPEKSPSDTEADKLFAEMDFVLAACAIGDSDSSMVDNEDNFTEETESDPATCCRQGKHQLVLDEQIGLKCKFCSFVKLEIKHILPSFSKHPLGRPDKNYWNSSDHFNFDKLQFQDSASTCNSKGHICAEGTVWDTIPGTKTSMYAHQREGLEFIWKNIGGSIYLEELKNSACDGGSGCIISHAPGTGKTRLAIVFLQTFMKLYPECRPVIVAPRSMLLTWEEEFKKWKVGIPFHNLNQPEFSGRENEAALNLLNKAGRQGKNMNSVRLVKLYSWRKGQSVLGISYRLFEKLAEDGIVSTNDEGGSKTKRKFKRYAEAEMVRKMLLELPGLLVLDEGHTPRNDQSLMWRALSGVETQRRILLSGTPFQNNFDELFNTLCLVRPKFCDRIVTGIKGDSRRNRGREGRKGRGKWASLTKSIGKDAGDKLNELRALIDPFVHVHKGMILKENLPGLRDAMVFLNPTEFQKTLIGVIQGRPNVFNRDHLASLISVHPSLLLGHALSDEEGLSIDTNELETLRFDSKAGVKTNFLMELIRLSMAVKEKVLVFSQFIEPLTIIREQLKSSFGWTEGKDLLYMDGKIEARHRQSSISLLNDPDSQVQVLLASIRACSEGISLVGASRVVLLDVLWNPSVERQAISRAYRIGQKKVVYIYRLITSGTMEGEKCARQAEKDRLSELVFSSADGKLHRKETISRAVNDDKILEEMVQHEKISYMFEKILNQPEESNLIHTCG
ncbi:SNF2 domain-containing protein CLASSY 4-like [Rhododendron vialii]|uniref:SNF2 domain-containing protein CLASSY 4-like n=1 Tax=Rhododendron vialii TaxID=182163 RepID=UPI00265DE016|nr:SNF2 domain-containing protein CLASSY 4-like [Rhododendron vialii]